MNVSAYVLVQTELGAAEAVASAVRELPGIDSADDVTGPYDVIVRAHADDVDQLARMVVSAIQAVPGITRTLTCPIVRL